MANTLDDDQDNVLNQGLLGNSVDTLSSVNNRGANLSRTFAAHFKTDTDVFQRRKHQPKAAVFI